MAVALERRPITAQGNADHILWGRIESSSASNFSGRSSASEDNRQTRRNLAHSAVLRSESNSSFSANEKQQQQFFGSIQEGSEANARYENNDEESRCDAILDQVEEMLENQQQMGPEHIIRILESQGINAEEIVKQVPVNERGFPTSLGSIGHYDQRCREPCLYTFRAKGCADGVYCTSCHFAHGRRRRRIKDGKSKRDRYRRLREDMMNQIDAAPDNFPLVTEALPECIAKDERLKGKLMNRLRIHQEEAKKKLLSL